MEIIANNKLPWTGIEPRLINGSVGLLPDLRSKKPGFDSRPWQFIICNNENDNSSNYVNISNNKNLLWCMLDKSEKVKCNQDLETIGHECNFTKPGSIVKFCQLKFFWSQKYEALLIVSTTISLLWTVDAVALQFPYRKTEPKTSFISVAYS